MNSRWVENKIVDILAKKKNAISMGPFGSRIKKENFVLNGVPIIKGGNLTDRYLMEDNFDFLTEEKADELRTSMAFRGDIVITHRGTIGQVGLVPDDSKFDKYIVSQSQLKFTLDTQKADPYFVFYFFKTHVGQHQLLQNASQVGVPAIARASSAVKDIIIHMPPLEEQKRITSLLRALDDKIENNHKINETLEETARTIYKSWFVDFDPVHAKASGNAPAYMDAEAAALFPNSFGNDGLPVGWKEISFDNLAKPKRGKVITKKKAIEGDFPVVAGGIKPAYYHNEYNAKSPVVTISASGNAGFVNIYYSNIWASDCSYINYDITKYVYFSHCFLKINQKKLFEMQHGAVQQHVNPNDIMRLTLKIGSNQILDKFEQTVSHLYKKISLNLEENQTLAEIRDNLLPKLISGEIRVKDTKREVEAAV